ncbi:MAG: DUF3090 family protein [Ferrimicrobium sp.]
MSRSIDFPAVEWCTTGTVGEPGRRIFLFQTGTVVDQITIKIEKGQLIALTQGIVAVLADLSRPHELPGEAPLHDPVEPEWIAGSLELSLDPVAELLEITLIELTENDEPATAVVWITKEQAAQFAIVATRLVGQGRPPCPLCGYPLDPIGHVCPRTNGHSAPAI